MSHPYSPSNNPDKTGNSDHQLADSISEADGQLTKCYRFLPFLNIIAWIMLIACVILASFYSWKNCATVYESNYWSAHRMFFPHVLLSDNNLYSTTTKGNYQFHIYGPLFPLYYLPATLAKNYRHEVIAGTFMSFLALLLPLTFVFYSVFRQNLRGGPLIYAVIVSLTAISYLFQSAMSNVAFRLHVDSMAIGSSLLSMGFLALYHNKKTVYYLMLSGCFLSISIFSKQTTALLVLLPFGYLFFNKQNGNRFKNLLLFFSPIFAISLLLLAHYGWDALYTNLFEMAKNHPLRRYNPYGDGSLYYFSQQLLLPYAEHQSVIEKIKIIFYNTDYFVVKNTFLCFLPPLLALSCFTNLESLRLKFLEKLLLAALPLFALTSILGFSKIGGDMSSMGYFLVVIFTLAITRLTTHLSSGQFRFIKMGCLLIVPLIIFGMGVYRTVSFYKGNHHTRPSRGELVYNYCLQNPGTVYFPAFNFEQFHAEKALYPVSDTLYSFDLANLAIKEDVLRKVLPQDVEYVVMDQKDPGYLTVKRLYKHLFTHIPVIDYDQLDEILREQGDAFYPSKK